MLDRSVYQGLLALLESKDPAEIAARLVNEARPDQLAALVQLGHLVPMAARVRLAHPDPAARQVHLAPRARRGSPLPRSAFTNAPRRT